MEYYLIIARSVTYAQRIERVLGRAGIRCTVFRAPFELTGGKLTCGESTLLWDAAGMKQNNGERIEKQFRALKFGQPSMTDLGENKWLLLHWSCENDQYAIRTRILEIQ